LPPRIYIATRENDIESRHSRPVLEYTALDPRLYLCRHPSIKRREISVRRTASPSDFDDRIELLEDVVDRLERRTFSTRT
jgi:hypothetical protein